MNRVNRYKRIKADLARFWSQGWIIGPSRHSADNEPYVAIMRAGETPEEVADESAEFLNRLHNVDLPWLLAEFERVNDMLASMVVNTTAPLTESQVRHGKKVFRHWSKAYGICDLPGDDMVWRMK